MEIREFALRVLFSDSLKGKLAAPTSALTDETPGPAVLVRKPARPPGLEIVPSSRAKVPAIEGMTDPAQRVRILHAFANHELQAAELFARALLAFPDAPGAFRRGLVRILRDEQRHCRMYLRRLHEHFSELGDHPVSGYFWSKVEDLETPLRFVCAMALTFESANLDHAVRYERAARDCGDERTAEVIRRVHEDEIGHVRFGWLWLGKLKEPGQSMCDAYRANVVWPLRPALAKGPSFHAESRRAAGLDPEFIEMVANADRSDRES